MKKFWLFVALFALSAMWMTGCTQGTPTVESDSSPLTDHVTDTEEEHPAASETDVQDESQTSTDIETETETETETATETETETETETIPQIQKDRLNVWYEHATVKVKQRASSSIKHSGMVDYTVYMAKNEAENAHILLYAPVAVEEISLEVSPLTNADGHVLEAELLRQYYVQNSLKLAVPDPLAPMTDETRVFDMAQRTCQSMFVKIKTTADTPAGDYMATVTVKAGDEAYTTLDLTCHVWDFSLPQITSTVTSVGMYQDQLTAYFPDADPTELYKQYYDFLLDNKIVAMDLPYSVLDDRADAYMNDPRVTSFRVWPDANMDAVYAKLKTNPLWLEKAYFYCVDEVYTEEQLEALKTTYVHLKEAYPEIGRVSPFYTIFDPDTGDTIDGFDVMREVIDIWCPLHGPAFTPWDAEKDAPDRWYMYKDPHGNRVFDMNAYIQQHGDFRDRLEAEVAEGDELWWYVCNSPSDNYTNLFIGQSGVTHRVLFWQQKQFNVTGFLYWTSNWWSTAVEQGKSPWEFPQFENNVSKTYGDGVLLYPGSDVGHDGPCSSNRLEAFRDGLEDHDLLTMYEELYGTEAMKSILDTVTVGMTEFTDDPEVLNAARIELGNAIEAAMK